jgi:2-polyprenyl-3-methyl-5-hydroxy-6-metoxy-1,4-benzoquinol methylase
MAMTASTVETTSDHFEAMYREAAGDPAHLPWERGHAHPALVSWLNAVAPSLIRCGARVAVVGCGLGHDARALARRGFDVTAFDCSITAIQWARRLDPEWADCFVQADLFEVPPRWRRRFDLVVEVHTLQSVSPDLRVEAMTAMRQLASPHGFVLAICRGAGQSAALESGPPWPLTVEELAEAAALAGLVPDGQICSFLDEDRSPPVRRIRALLRRA